MKGSRLVAGVDESGRGAVLGPLVVAGVLIRERQIPLLEVAGVRDSKLLTPQRREKLAKEILRTTIDHRFVELSPAEIDEVVATGSRLRRLNYLEAKAMAEVVTALRPDVAYVDAADVAPERFGRQVREFIPFSPTVVAEHKADGKYPVVAAASILAKVKRDELVAQLRAQHGDFGSGYMADLRTRAFLKDWLRRHGEYPDFARKSWKPLAATRL